MDKVDVILLHGKDTGKILFEIGLELEIWDSHHVGNVPSKFVMLGPPLLADRDFRFEGYTFSGDTVDSRDDIFFGEGVGVASEFFVMKKYVESTILNLGTNLRSLNASKLMTSPQKNYLDLRRHQFHQP